MTADAIEHIIRPSLPWRDAGLTECGRPVNDCAAVLTLDQAAAKWKKQGPTRAALTTCMTCCQTYRNWPTWEANPGGRLSRDISRYIYGQPKPETGLLNVELRAIALLIEAHREEFDATVATIQSAAGLAEAREKRVRRKLADGGRA